MRPCRRGCICRISYGCVWCLFFVEMLFFLMFNFYCSYLFAFHCICKYSQLHPNAFLTTSTKNEHDHHTTTRLTQHDNRLALCLRVILDSGARRWVQAGHPRYTGFRKGRPWVAHNLFHDRRPPDRRQALRQTCFQQTGVKTNVRYNNQVLTATWNLTVPTTRATTQFTLITAHHDRIPSQPCGYFSGYFGSFSHRAGTQISHGHRRRRGGVAVCAAR